MKLYKDKILLLFGLGSGLFSLIVYFLTKAPTLSFWDCGEFIACSDILGIPHPPGYPLFTLIGRFVILLPLPFDSAVKVNLVSVVSSAFTVFVAYWLIIRLVIGFEKQLTSIWQKLALGVGAFTGSLVMGFASTIWDNAIEAECYGLAMMLMLILAYLLLLWSNKIGRPGAGKLMVAISYLAFLSVGIHLTTFMVMPLFIAYIMIKDRKMLTDWRFWLVWLVLLMITAQMDIFLYGTAILFVFLLFWVASTRHVQYMTRLVFAIVLAAIVGYSTHLYLPIRADEKPAINENNPDNWDRFRSLLERKQYGQESMITRMFDRRATWGHQFGDYPHMGFWGFFKEQYSLPYVAFIYFALGIWGIYEAIRRNKVNGLWLLALFLVSTLGLILYLNFSDGTRGAILEVRNRDYFYTPGFMFFAILLGVGLSGLLLDLAEWIKDRPERKYLMTAALIVSILLPIHTLQANYFNHDRSRNYIPWDYAYNILSSVDENGIVFTNGDNDTFPLWYIQEVEHFRTDIRVVNLSLLNTPWYIHQLKDQMNVPISKTYDQIENLRPRWDAAKNKIWRVQDEMVSNIIRTNNWEQPIFFAVTVSDDNKLGLENNMIMQGMAYKIVPTEGTNRIDPDLMWKDYMEVFKFRGLADSTIYKSENDTRLVANYISGFLQLADTLRKSNDFDKAIQATQRSIEIFPDEWRHRAYLASLYAETNRMDDLEHIISEVKNPEDVNKIYLSAAQEALYNGEDYTASQLLLRALDADPKSMTVFNNLIFIEDKLGNTQITDSLIETWRNRFADDTEIQSNLDNIQKALESRRKQK